MVTAEERVRLFEMPLEERLQTNTNLLVLWLQTVQLIANRQLPYWSRQTTARLSLYKFFNRVRPPELDEVSPFDSDGDGDEVWRRRRMKMKMEERSLNMEDWRLKIKIVEYLRRRRGGSQRIFVFICGLFYVMWFRDIGGRVCGGIKSCLWQEYQSGWSLAGNRYDECDSIW